ncbi:MAG TPA: hypothetical protein VGC85_02250 [Chthoniobacterales bacterium]
MKKLLVVVVLAAAVAFAIWFGRRNGSARISSATVTSLLPNDTIAFLHVPDVRAARAQWHQSDLYKLWREPAVQDFLQKPLAQNAAPSAAAEKFAEFDTLGIRDAFLAVLPAANDQQKFVGGFRFEGRRDDVERVMDDWRARAGAAGTQTKRETVPYQQHQIEVATDGAVTVATVYDGEWFFAASEIGGLQILLDRLDGRLKDPAATLSANEDYGTAFKHMPQRYVAFGYARLEPYFAKLASMTEDSSIRGRVEFLRNVHSAAAAIGFLDGKVRDVLFVGMPKIPDQPDLTRSSLALTTADSFLYAASVLDFPQASASAGPTSGIPPAMQGFFSQLNANAATTQDWKSAFGSELGVVGDWSANARIPSLLLTLPVKDGTKARELVRALTVGGGEESRWTLSDKGGVQYCFQAPATPMLPVAATIAVSDRQLVAGLDPIVVETAMNQIAGANGALTSSQQFRTAERLVGEPKNHFAYIDTTLLYTRLDAAVRPMLVMAAAFMPSLVQNIDINKLPPPDVVTKHLSPIVLSQNYDRDGYVAESVGPISLFEAGVAAAAAAMAGTELYRRQFPNPNGP